MDNRLSLIKNMVQPCKCVADIGTDHGYLVVALVAEGIAEKGIAADINQMPLDTAIKHILDNNLSDKIKAICTDGLSMIEKNTDAVTIAGMGGELIVKIIDSWEYKRNKGVNYYLQPMTKPEILRKYLYENGYEIIKENCCIANNRPYSVMQVIYTGKIEKFKIENSYIGSIQKPYNKECKIYLKRLCSRMQKKIMGLTQSEINQKNILYWKTVYNKIEMRIEDESITNL